MAKEKLAKDKSEEWVHSILSLDESVLLYKTMLLKDIPCVDGIGIIKDLLKIKTPDRLALASIVNAIFTQQTSAFMITKRGLDKLMYFDKNHELGYLHSRTYQVLMQSLAKSNFLEIREKPVGRKGGLYILRNERVIDALKLIMIDEAYEDIERKRIENFYTFQNYDELSFSDEDRELIAKEREEYERSKNVKGS